MAFINGSTQFMEIPCAYLMAAVKRFSDLYNFTCLFASGNNVLLLKFKCKMLTDFNDVDTKKFAVLVYVFRSNFIRINLHVYEIHFVHLYFIGAYQCNS